MTLLVNFYTSKGIVFAADQAITVRKPGGLERWEKGSKQRKVHKVTQLGLNGGVIDPHSAPQCAPAELREYLRLHAKNRAMPWWFRNGDLPFAGRAWAGVEAAILAITTSQSGFGVPDTLDHWGALARAVLRLAGDLYPVLVNSGAPSIEGPFDVAQIPWP
jgi:hypothetical protein